MIRLISCRKTPSAIGVRTVRESWLTALALVVALTAARPGLCRAQASPNAGPGAPANPATSSWMTLEQERASTATEHRYASPDERAHDDLIVVEVKSALAHDGVSRGHPVEVDADHGTVLLSGVVASPAAANHAAQVARGIDGVTGVDNRLSWR
jgi:BON domain-containing protein